MQLFNSNNFPFNCYFILLGVWTPENFSQPYGETQMTMLSLNKYSFTYKKNLQ